MSASCPLPRFPTNLPTPPEKKEVSQIVGDLCLKKPILSSPTPHIKPIHLPPLPRKKEIPLSYKKNGERRPLSCTRTVPPPLHPPPKKGGETTQLQKTAGRDHSAAKIKREETTHVQKGGRDHSGAKKGGKRPLRCKKRGETIQLQRPLNCKDHSAAKPLSCQDHSAAKTTQAQKKRREPTLLQRPLSFQKSSEGTEKKAPIYHSTAQDRDFNFYPDITNPPFFSYFSYINSLTHLSTSPFLPPLPPKKDHSAAKEQFPPSPPKKGERPLSCQNHSAAKEQFRACSWREKAPAHYSTAQDRESNFYPDITSPSP